MCHGVALKKTKDKKKKKKRCMFKEIGNVCILCSICVYVCKQPGTLILGENQVLGEKKSWRDCSGNMDCIDQAS